MKVLGLCHDVLICSAAVVVDGRVVSAICEERLDRQKQSRVFPSLAIDRCLAQAGLKLTDIDEIAVGWNPGLELETMPGGYFQRRWRTEHLSIVPGRLMQVGRSSATDEITITGAAKGCPPITYVNHYDAHIGNALHLSGWDEAAILVMDGRAERQTSLLARAKGVHLDRLAEVQFPHSLGLFYGAITQHLGFKPDSDEWKVMALASFAPSENEFTPILRELIHVNEDGTFEVRLDHFEYHNFFDRRMYGDKLVKALGPVRERSQPLDDRHQRIAAAMQQVFEETATAVATALHRRTGLDRLVVSGGCFMNSVFNGKITTVTPFKECFVSSCPDDSGTSIGAALWLHGQRTGARPTEPCLHNYWGPEYSDAECLAVAKRYRLPNVEVVADPAARAAQDLVDGRILGWFQGPMEFGQRALGHRSILIDPRRQDGKDVVNAAVKFRESFRPFAPAILEERVAEWFECEPGTKVPFMEKVLQFRPAQAERVPAVVHVDGSGRLQSVGPDGSRYRALIEAFEALTGVPIVLNTSFNLNGEPIVCAPDDAVRTFYTCALDVLYLGNVRISK